MGNIASMAGSEKERRKNITADVMAVIKENNIVAPDFGFAPRVADDSGRHGQTQVQL